MKKLDDPRRIVAAPQNGDILITKRHSAVDHDVTIVPGGTCVTHARFDVAVEAGGDSAQQLGVDLWMTEDHIHFRRLATYWRDGGPLTAARR